MTRSIQIAFFITGLFCLYQAIPTEGILWATVAWFCFSIVFEWRKS